MIFMVASHGVENVIYGTDFQKIDVYEELVRPFHNFNCEGLRGKPKIFVINSCRGDRARNARIYYDGPKLSVKNGMAHDNGLIIKSERSGILVQDIGDFAVIFSTGPESVSIRDPESGSLLLRKLFTKIKELAESGTLSKEEFT